MKRFFNWLSRKQDDRPKRSGKALSQSGAYKAPSKSRRAEAAAASEFYATETDDKIADGGPGKNVLIRNRYVREDTGTHETLKIIDDSILEDDVDTGADPYNTGRFDRSRSWDSSRSRK